MGEMNEARDAEAAFPGEVTRRVVVTNQLGLHARPAGKLAHTAHNFKASISIVCQDQEVDAKSILEILTLAAATKLGRELFGRRGAVWTLAALAGLYWHVHISHLALRANL